MGCIGVDVQEGDREGTLVPTDRWAHWRRSLLCNRLRTRCLGTAEAGAISGESSFRLTKCCRM